MTAGDRHAYAVLLLITALLALGLVSPATAAEPTVIITDYEVNPSVILPGEMGTITITLKNTAESATQSASDTFDTGTKSYTTTTSTDISAKVESATLVGKGVEVVRGSFQDIGSIGPGQSLSLTFLIRAPSSDGIYFPEAWISASGGTNVRYPIPVNVNSAIPLPKNPAIVVEKSAPNNVNPGDDFFVNLTITNAGEIRANNIDLSFRPNTSSIALKSPSTHHLARLDPGESQVLNLSFASDRNAPLGLAVVSIPIGYVRADGSRFEQTEQASINLQGEAELSISAISTDPAPITPGEPFSLIVRIENTGTDDATALKARIDASLSGSKEAFVGKIKPGSDAPAVFTLTAEGIGDIPVTVNLSYEDRYGPHTESEEVTLVVNQPSGSGTVLAALGLLTLAAALTYWYLRVHKRADHA
ncbi:MULTISPECIES: COG1361 S-layer family protein [unclassified Methanoculleus]|uniref:S-layer protein n=1 Tax=Methanoculleus palmolei TaxID=72612 RepID=A0ABD8AAL6_9EURY|nr:S-layer protein [Methanoculleus sp. UBA377]WOX56072.1 S-layer protein [Methanoculleus palmolei]